MARVRKKSLTNDEEQETSSRKGKRKVIEDEDDEVGLDEFEVDGFLVDNDEDDEDGGDEEEMLKKKKKRKRSSKGIVLDDDDLELIRENENINQEKLSDGKFKRLKKTGVDTKQMEHASDEGSLFDDFSEDESNDAEDDMGDFIVDEDVGSYGNGDSLRQKKLKEAKQSSLLSKKAKRGSGKAGSPEEHNGSDDPKNMDVAGEGNSLADTDLPERLQIIEDIVGSIPVDKTSIEEESSWILCQITSSIHPLYSAAKSCGLVDAVNREDIVRFLELHHIKKYDIPFIAMYRKEQCPSLLQVPKEEESEDTLLNDCESKPKLNQHKILWIIKELDKKWLLLQKRKSMLKRHYNKHFEEECQMSFVDEESSFRQEIYDSIIDMLEKAETEKEIDDVDMKFNLYFPPADEFFSSGYKRPQTKSYYSDCRKAGLLSLARKFGNPDNFSSLVTLNKVGMDSVDDPEESLEEMASIYKCETFQSSEAVLKGARHMAVLMLSCEVPFRKHVRSLFMHNALVSTNPTLKGSIAIDSFHEFAGFKWLKDKPLLKFEDSQWLLIQKAEEEKLLQVEIKFPDNALNELMMTCNRAYLKDSEGASTQLWNEQRKSILQDTITNLLLPSMEKDARALLNAKAKNWLLMKYGMQWWSRVSVAPFLNNDNAQERGVVACCWENGKPGTAFVMLDSRGELVDVMHAGSLTLRSQNINDQQRRKNDQTRVLKFLTIHRPNVIVIGAANSYCIRLKEDINEIISMMSEDSFQDASQEMNGLPAVVLGDEDLPRLYEDSEISMSQLPRQYGIVKRAVALGRYLLNPLVMVATLCGVNKEVVSWKLNPLEKFLSSDEKMEMIEWIMIDITNQVGIDVNSAIRHDWLLAPLQFVSGLGPRKGAIFHRELLGGTDVRNRRDFAKFGLNTKKVFCNAVGFLKVSCDDPNLVDTAGNILDRTRIHPESYSLAEELAKAVIHKHYADADDTQLNAIECIQNDPKLLESFDLNEHANRLEVEKSECRRATLCDIKMELLHGFKDPRSPYKEPTQDDEFCMIAGETGAALVEGERVQATVGRVLSRQAFCMLDSGVSGILFREDFSDDIGDISLTEKLREGVVLTCKIKLVDKNRCQVNLTCKASELKNVGEQSLHDMDPYYCQGDIILPSQQEATEKQEVANKSFLPRTICHPHFQNITADQAKEFLADKAVGEYIFHPSSKGLCYLTISLKLFNELYVHKDILEGGKSHDMKSLPGLGKTLKVGEEIFESIDEVIENYVNPLVVHLKAFINFRKFKKGSKAEVDELLKLEKEEHPNRIPYGFGISYEHPGVFILSYIRSTNPHHEYIAIHPKGFKFRQQIFNNVEQLLAYFQNHINDNVGRAKDKAAVGSKGGSGGACYKCGETGHMARDCSQEGDGGGGRGGGRGGGGRGGGRGGGGACYKCGESGHMSRDCTREGGGGACYKCGESGHMARDCTQEGGGGGGGGGGACYKCGESGHMARECSQGGGGGGGACYKCGESGHMARECSQGGGGGGGACYKCGESGHMARDCSQENGGGGGWSGGGGRGGGGACYKCGESGHMARDCTQGSDNDTGNGRGAGFRGGRGRGRGRDGGGRGFGSSSHSRDDSISDVNDGGSGWGGTGGGSWGGKSTNEESNITEGSWGLKAASNAGTGNENSGWGGAQENNATPSDGGSGWGGTGGKSWGGKSSNEESKTEKGSWGLTAASNAGSGNDNSGWKNANGKSATTSGSDSGWGGTGGKSWGGNSTNEESKIEKGGWGGGGDSGLGGTGGKSWGGNSANEESKKEKGGWGSGGGSGWGGTGGESDSGLGGTGGKSWGGNSANEESKKEKGGWGSGSDSGWGGTGGKSWGGNSANEESKKEKGGWGSGSDSGLGGTGGKSWGGNSANEESKIEKGGWSDRSDSGLGGTGGKSWGGSTANEETKKEKGSWGGGNSANEESKKEKGGWGNGSDSGWGGAGGKSWGGNSANEESKKEKGGWGSGSDNGWGGAGGKSWGGNSANEESKKEKGGWGNGSDSGWGGAGGKSWGGNSTNEESKTAKGSWGGGSDSGWGGAGGKSWGGNSTNEESSIAEGGGGGYGGGGGRGGGRGGRGGGGACYKCGESGHMARDCSQASEGGGRGGSGGRGGGRGSGSCYNCGESGHMARECSQGSGGGGRGGRGGGACYKCGESGHMARDCTQDGGGGGGGGWRGGGGQGGGRGGACYKCGESGHMARDCSQSGGGGGGRFGGSSGSCYKCGESGHFARECPASTN